MLTDVQIRKAKGAEAAYKLADSNGLHLYVTPGGSKLWRYRYRFGGKEKLLSLGQYPDVSLSEARTARDEAKDLLKTGRDPSVTKKLEKLVVYQEQGETFEVIGREWHELNKKQWVERHAYDVLHSLEKEVFPFLGFVPIRNITAPEVLAVLRRIERREAIETARRVRQRMSAIFVYAIATGRASNDPAAIVQQAMAPLLKGRMPAITTLDGVRRLIEDVEGTPAHPMLKLAHRYLAITAVRPGVVARTPWTELRQLVDSNRPIWQIPAVRMKLRLVHKDNDERDHLVPLPWQAVEVLRTLTMLTGGGTLAFPNTRRPDKPYSENTLNRLIERAGYDGETKRKHVGHGWRAAFSSIMNERFPADQHVIDLMLAHVPKDKVEGAYNRALYIDRRAELAQAWADLILEGMPPAIQLLEGPRKAFNRAA